MENLTSRKEKFSESNTKHSLTKKITILAIAGSITVGAGAVLGASPLLANIQSFISNTLGTEKSELSNQGNTTQGAVVTDIETFLTNLKTRISTELGNHNETEKTRTNTEISQYNDQLQTEADAQATTDITSGKTELTNTANTEISEAKAALDAKYAEIFPAPTTP